MRRGVLPHRGESHPTPCFKKCQNKFPQDLSKIHHRSTRLTGGEKGVIDQWVDAFTGSIKTDTELFGTMREQLSADRQRGRERHAQAKAEIEAHELANAAERRSAMEEIDLVLQATEQEALTAFLVTTKRLFEDLVGRADASLRDKYLHKFPFSHVQSAQDKESHASNLSGTFRALNDDQVGKSSLGTEQQPDLSEAVLGDQVFGVFSGEKGIVRRDSFLCLCDTGRGRRRIRIHRKTRSYNLLVVPTQ